MTLAFSLALSPRKIEYTLKILMKTNKTANIGKIERFLMYYPLSFALLWTNLL